MKLYAHTRYLPEGLPHSPLLCPFWGPLPALTRYGIGARRFERYRASGADVFQMTSLADADAAVLPFDWEQIVPRAVKSRRDVALFGKDAETVRRTIAFGLQAARDLAAEASAARKPIIVFLGHDDDGMTVPIEDSWTFRSSLYASRRRPRECAQPFWLEDEIETRFAGQLPLRAKQPVPTVSFCGFVAMRPDREWVVSLAHRSRAPLHRWAEPFIEPSFRPRARALRQFSRSLAVRTRFILRQRWFDGVFSGEADAGRAQDSQRAYFSNIIESDYVLCTRGYRNCSIRLYETLCCGRIPVFVNTDSVMPCDRWIDWTKHCVWVDEKDLPDIAEKVAAFHAALSPDEFLARQHACRQLWLDWLSPEGFFRNLHRHLA